LRDIAQFAISRDIAILRNIKISSEYVVGNTLTELPNWPRVPM